MAAKVVKAGMPNTPRRMQASMRVLWLCEHKLCLCKRPPSSPGPSDERRSLSESNKRRHCECALPLMKGCGERVSSLKLLTQNRRQYILSLLHAVQTSCWDQLGSSTVERHHSSPRLLPWPVPRFCVAWVHGWWNASHKRKTAEQLAWCHTASSLCCFGRLSEPLQQKLCYPVQRLRAKLAEEQAAEQRALCLAAQAELEELQHHFCLPALEGPRVVRVELTTRFAFGLNEIQGRHCRMQLWQQGTSVDPSGCARQSPSTTGTARGWQQGSMESCNAFCSSRQRSGGSRWPYSTIRGCKKAVRFCEIAEKRGWEERETKAKKHHRECALAFVVNGCGERVWSLKLLTQNRRQYILSLRRAVQTCCCFAAFWFRLLIWCPDRPLTLLVLPWTLTWAWRWTRFHALCILCVYCSNACVRSLVMVQRKPQLYNRLRLLIRFRPPSKGVVRREPATDVAG